MTCHSDMTTVLIQPCKQKMEIVMVLGQDTFLRCVLVFIYLFIFLLLWNLQIGLKTPPWCDDPSPLPLCSINPQNLWIYHFNCPLRNHILSFRHPVPSSSAFFATLAFHQRIEPSGFNTLMNVKRDAAFCLILKKEPLIQERDQFTLASSSSLSVGILALEKCPPLPTASLSVLSLYSSPLLCFNWLGH